MNVVPIVFSFDNNLEMPAGVCLTSLLENASLDTFYDIFILHSNKCDFSNALINKLPLIYPRCRITWRSVGNVFEGAYEIRGITEPAYYRLLIPEVIQEYDKILYSDVDVIFRKDLWELYTAIDIKDYYLGAVDVASSIRSEIISYKEILGIKSHRGYFNSGFLLINSFLMRECKICDEFKLLSKNKYKYQDQDILNIACKDRVKYLPPEFNLQVVLIESFFLRKEALIGCFTSSEITRALESGILHYNGTKPWKGICYNQDVWWYYYRKSIYYQESFVIGYYRSIVNEVETWTLYKRIKHVFRYFWTKK